MISFITKDELGSRIIKKIEYVEHSGCGCGLISLSSTTARKYESQNNWQAIGEIYYNKFYPWWDVYLNTQEKVDCLRTIIRNICEEKMLYYEL